MLHTLYGQAMKHNTQFFVEYFALDLIMDNEGKKVFFCAVSFIFTQYFTLQDLKGWIREEFHRLLLVALYPFLSSVLCWAYMIVALLCINPLLLCWSLLITMVFHEPRFAYKIQQFFLVVRVLAYSYNCTNFHNFITCLYFSCYLIG